MPTPSPTNPQESETPTPKLDIEIETIQSLERRLREAEKEAQHHVNDFIVHHHGPIVAQMNNQLSQLESKLTAYREIARRLADDLKELNRLNTLTMICYFDTEHSREAVEVAQIEIDKHRGTAGLWADIGELVSKALTDFEQLEKEQQQ